MPLKCVSPALLEHSYSGAVTNWGSWRDCYEAAPRDLPAVHDLARFRKFAHEYGLLRGLTTNRRLELREWLLKEKRMERLVADPCGKGVDGACVALQADGFRNERSLLSKLATFADPVNFIPYDRFAVAGLATLTGQPKSAVARSYRNYLGMVHSLRDGDLGEVFDKFIATAQVPTKNVAGFKLRMIDDYLMQVGQRWSATAPSIAHQAPNSAKGSLSL